MSKCRFDTAYNTSCWYGVDKHKPKLSEYNAFYNNEVLQDFFEGLLLLIDIMNKGFVPCSTDEDMATFYRDSLPEFLFSFVLEKYIVCDVCGLRPASFETSTVSYISPTNDASVQELVL